MKRTIPILLPKDGDLLATMRLFRNLANEVSRMAFEVRDKLNRKFDLRRHCYHTLRKRYPKVNSRVLEYIIKIVAGCYSKKKREKLEAPAVFKKDFALLDERLFRFDGQTLSIWTIAGRKEYPFTFVPTRRFKELWGKATGIDSIILKECNGKIIAHVCLTIPASQENAGNHYVGIDLGAVCPIVAVRDDGKIFFPNSEYFHKKRKEFLEQRRYLQKKLATQRWLKKDAHNTVRALKRLSQRQRRFTRQYIHWVINRLLTWAGNAVIIMERLRLPKGKKIKGAKALNRTLSLLPYGVVRDAVVQKAQERGLKVVFVNPAGTSQTCPQCGAQGERTQRNFKCPSCGFSCHADIVGAMNILRRGLQGFSHGGAEAGDEPAAPSQPQNSVDLPRRFSAAGKVESHYSPSQERLQSTSKRKRATGGRLQPTLF